MQVMFLRSAALSHQAPKLHAQLDDVVPAVNVDAARFEEATYRTTRWLDRCIKAHSRPTEQVRWGRRLRTGAGPGGAAAAAAGTTIAGCSKRTQRTAQHTTKQHSHPLQSLFPIVQGGFDVRLREVSMQQLTERGCPGHAIGGLAGGEGKDVFWRVVAQCTAGLPPGKPRYVMGIGYPLDIVVCR